MAVRDENGYLGDYREQFQEISLDAQKEGEDLTKAVIKGMKYRLLEPDYETWLKECLKCNDWNGLNNMIFQTNRHDLLPSSSGGYDHCELFLGLLGAFACGDIHAVERIFPHELGLTANGYPFYVVASNLFIALWYQDENMLKQALPKAEAFIATKKPQWERAVVAYLLALYNKDTAEAQTQLQEVCKSYMRSDMASFKKLLCVEAHGLYCMAYYLLPEDQYQQLHMPEYKNFSVEYAVWRREHPEPELNLYFEYPAPMELVNQIYLAPIAVTKLHQPYLGQDNPYMSAKAKKQWCLDVGTMLDDFTNGVTEGR